MCEDKDNKAGKEKKGIEKSAQPDPAGDLSAEMEKLTLENKELKDDALRRLAEFENYRKHLEREKQEYTLHANQKLISELLEIADNLERCVSETGKRDAEAAAGMELIRTQFMKILSSAGLRPIESLGRSFDPYRHEAFLRKDSEDPEGTVIEELQRGYMLHDKVLRHSKVVISSGAKEKGSKDE